MKTTIRYRLSEQGQKQALLNGLQPTPIQETTIEKDHPRFAEFVELAEVSSEGATLDTTQRIYTTIGNNIEATQWDKIPTIDELLDDHKKRQTAKEQQEQATKDAKRQETLDVIRQRKTKTTQRQAGNYPHQVSYDQTEPDWPYLADSEIKESPEATQWLQELQQINEQAEQTAKTKSDELQQQAEQAANEKREKEQLRRAALNMTDDDIDIRLEKGALCSAPCWENHQRGKNWFAIIDVDPSSPGGLSREFATKAKGSYYYLLPNNLQQGDAVEFGADYYSSRGKKSTERWYGYVKEIRDDVLILTKSATGKKACQEAQAYLDSLTQPTA